MSGPRNGAAFFDHDHPDPVSSGDISSHFPGGVGMRDFYQVLREKELEVSRVREEIEALRSIIPLLQEEGDDAPPDSTVYAMRAVNHE
jgi:hypothetical protein